MKDERKYKELTHEELVLAVYELAMQLDYEEQKRLIDEVLAKRK